MNRFLLPAILAMVLTARAAPEERGQLDASPTLFAVMAAMDAAGVGVNAASGANHPLRAAVRAEIAKRTVPSLDDLKRYFQLHRQKNDTLELNQYVSFALAAGPPPLFELKHRDVDLPPDVVPLQELSSVLAAFWKEANLEDLWRRSQPYIDQALARYQPPVAEAVLQVNSYLRQQTSGMRGRRFQVFVELLGPPNQVQTRSFGFQYTIMVTPAAAPQIHDIRHGYLHYLLDPVATKYQEVLLRKRGLGDHAQRAVALADSYKSDFLLLATESLIQAVESRLDRRPVQVTEALKEGYILTPYFAEALPAYEKQEQAMGFYFADMAKAIDLKKEDARLSGVEFAREERVRHVKSTPVEAAPALTGAAKTLEDAEQMYTARNLDQAKERYLQVLQQTDERPMHAQAYYGLARISVLQKEPEAAERLFQKTLESMPEAGVKAWALVYLGRLADASGDREEALKHYREALEVKGASQKAREAAEQGAQQSSKR